MLSHPEREPEPDPIAGDVIEAFEAGRREYGAPRLKRELAKRGIVASRRRITRIMRENGLFSSFTRSRLSRGSAASSRSQRHHCCQYNAKTFPYFQIFHIDSYFL